MQKVAMVRYERSFEHNGERVVVQVERKIKRDESSDIAAAMWPHRIAETVGFATSRGDKLLGRIAKALLEEQEGWPDIQAFDLKFDEGAHQIFEREE